MTHRASGEAARGQGGDDDEHRRAGQRVDQQHQDDDHQQADAEEAHAAGVGHPEEAQHRRAGQHHRDHDRHEHEEPRAAAGVGAGDQLAALEAEERQHDTQQAHERLRRRARRRRHPRSGQARACCGPVGSSSASSRRPGSGSAGAGGAALAGWRPALRLPAVSPPGRWAGWRGWRSGAERARRSRGRRRLRRGLVRPRVSVGGGAGAARRRRRRRRRGRLRRGRRASAAEARRGVGSGAAGGRVPRSLDGARVLVAARSVASSCGRRARGARATAPGCPSQPWAAVCHAAAPGAGRLRQPPHRPPAPGAVAGRHRSRNSSSALLNSPAWLTLNPCGAPATTTVVTSESASAVRLPGDLEGHGGVGVAVEHQGGDGDAVEVRAEVGPGEGVDAGHDGLVARRDGELERLLALHLGDLHLAVGGEEVLHEAVEEVEAVRSAPPPSSPRPRSSSSPPSGLSEVLSR